MGSAKGSPDVEISVPRRVRQRSRRTFFRSVASEGIVVEPGRAPRRSKRFRFVEKSCLQLEDSARVVQVELVQLRAEVAGLRSEIRWSTPGRGTGGERSGDDKKGLGQVGNDIPGDCARSASEHVRDGDGVREELAELTRRMDEIAGHVARLAKSGSTGIHVARWRNTAESAEPEDIVVEEQPEVDFDVASTASSADMDGADMELRDESGLVSHKLMLQCARELKVMMRESVEVRLQGVESRVSEVTVRQDRLEERVIAGDQKAVQSRRRHRAAILELEKRSEAEIERSKGLARSLSLVVGYSAAIDAQVAVAEAVKREGPFFCCSLADDYVTGSVRARGLGRGESDSQDWSERLTLHDCGMGPSFFAKLGGGCRFNGWGGETPFYDERYLFSSKDYFYWNDYSDGEITYWTEWTRATARDAVRFMLEERGLEYWPDQFKELMR